MVNVDTWVAKQIGWPNGNQSEFNKHEWNQRDFIYDLSDHRLCMYIIGYITFVYLQVINVNLFL